MSRSFCLVLWFACFAAHAEALKYLEAMPASLDRGTVYGVKVVKVRPGSPTHRSGLKTNDLIVGADGIRVRSRRELALVLDRRPCRTAVKLALVRDKRITTITIRHPYPGRQLGATLREAHPDFLRLLKAKRLFPFGERSPSDSICRLENLDANLKEVLCRSLWNLREGGATEYWPLPITRMLRCFPVRGQEALGRLAPDKAAWGGRLVKTYLLLKCGQFSAAREVIALHKLDADPGEPFLAGLRTYYQRVIDGAGSNGGFDFASDPESFLLCYPFPYVLAPGELKRPFGFDPAFEKAYAQADIHAETPSAETKRAANRFVRAGHQKKDLGQRYLHHLRGALLHDRMHQGWAHRGYLTAYACHREPLFQDLKDAWESRPKERAITAMGLALLSFIEKDSVWFEKAYAKVAETGFEPLARVNALLRRIARRRGKSVVAKLEEWTARAAGKVEIPRIYRQLAKHSEALRQRLTPAPFDARLERCIRYPAFVERHPLFLIRNLRAPRNDNWTERLASLLESPERSQIDDAVGRLAQELARNPQQEHLDLFLKLARDASQDKVFDHVCRLIAFHHASGQYKLIKVSGLAHYFRTTEAEHYESACKRLTKLSADAADLDDTIHAILREATTPAVLLAVSKRLRELGRTGQSRVLTDKVVAYHHAMTEAYRSNSVLWGALRDFASTPGFHHEANPYNRDFGVNSLMYDSTMVLSAMLLTSAGRTAGATGRILQSVSVSVQQDEGQFPYKGRVHESLADLRAAVIRDLMDSGKLTEKQLGQLKGEPGLSYIFSKNE